MHTLNRFSRGSWENFKVPFKAPKRPACNAPGCFHSFAGGASESTSKFLLKTPKRPTSNAPGCFRSFAAGDSERTSKFLLKTPKRLAGFVYRVLLPFYGLFKNKKGKGKSLPS